MPEEATYKINQSGVASGTKCVCEHTISAHGSNGKICAACPCVQFQQSIIEDLKAIDAIIAENP